MALIYGELLVSKANVRSDVWSNFAVRQKDWPLLRGFISPVELRMLLPGRLPHNSSETVPLSQRYGAELVWTHDDPRSEADEIIANMMKEIIALDVGDGTDAWAQDGWYCIDCVQELLRQRLWQWWHAKKREGNALASVTNELLVDTRWFSLRQLELEHLTDPTAGEYFC